MSQADARMPKVAVLMTAFYYRSHAHCFIENLLYPCLFNGVWHPPRVQIAGFYVDQFPHNDMSRAVAADHAIPIYPTIAEALCLGGSELAVDAVLIIAEHGDYPVNERLQPMFPRKRFFDASADVFRGSGRSVPVYNDKHLAHRFDWAREMYDVAQELAIPFMAGGSVPLAERRPPVDVPAGAPIREILAVHNGPIEAYDFHAIEIAQSVAEFRRGGETGVERVAFVQGDALWDAADAGAWSPALALAAMEAELGRLQGPPRQAFRALADREGWDLGAMHAIIVTHRDGLRSTALKIGAGTPANQHTPNRYDRWNLACRIDGEPTPIAFTFYTGPWQNRNLFKALSHAIQAFFVSGEAPYPVERTLLTTGILDAAMHARALGGPVDTPELAIAYAARDFCAYREMGASWRIITEETPEPDGLACP